MSFSKNLTITVRNTDAQLNEPLYVYEKDRNLIMYFKIMDYKYKFDKNPTNVLASVDDIMEAYATIVDPNGYELTRQYGEVIDDEIKFVITDDLIDELDEIGTYRLQFHIKCQHSEFTIPEISFEVLERLKGFRTVTDEGEVGDEILNNSESFIDAEGKLHLVWREGDTISSVRLNQMVEVVNNAVDEEHQRQINEVNRENRANAKLNELETRFSALTTSQQQSAEVIDARDGEASLKARLDRDIKKPLEYYGDVEGSYISTDSTAGYLKDVEILGNTIQNEDNLADIRSVGDKVEGQELYEIPVLSCGKNLINPKLETGSIADSTGDFGSNTNYTCDQTYYKVKPNTSYVFTCNTNRDKVYLYDKDKNFIQFINIASNNVFSTTVNTEYLRYRFRNPKPETIGEIQLEEGTVATSYEPYQEDKLTILSPVQLEKVGDVADGIVEKDGVLGVEKNVKTITNFDNLRVFMHTEVFNNTIRVECYLDGKIGSYAGDSTSVITDKFPSVKNYNIDEVGIFIASGVDKFYIRINKSDITTTPTNMVCLNYIKENLKVMKLKSSNPQFIPLPHDQQVKLRTFANKTNISFLTEIEGTIKAQVPKSLGVTVNTHTEQISNLNKELDRVKKLEESTVSTVTTESDFTTVEATSNGYFEDVKLEGKTLVNLLPKINFAPPYGRNKQISDYPFNFKKANLVSNKLYTICIYGDTSILQRYVTVTNVDGKDMVIDLNPNGTALFKFVSELGNSPISKLHIYGKNNTTELTKTYLNSLSVSLLEGDHTQNPPSYFEGLKSVGQDVDEILVSSVNSDNTKSDKKRLLYYNNETQAWEKPILPEWDSIEKHSDGKYYYHQRSGEVVLNGSEDWAQYKSPNSKNVYGYYAILNCKVGVSYNIAVCNKLTPIYPDAFPGNVSENAYVGCIYVGGSEIGYVKIATDITTLAGFKQWLQANNVTVVYQLAQEKVYECTNIDLITYANETNYIVESGAIAPKSILKVHSNIANVISALQKKVSVLESNYVTLFNTITAAFNSLE